MASNPRKRPADLKWKTPIDSKISKLVEVDHTSAASDGRQKAIQQMDDKSPWRQQPSTLSLSRQRDLHSYTPDRLLRPKAIFVGAPNPAAQAPPTPPGQNPTLAAPGLENSHTSVGLIQFTVYRPNVLHPPHPASKIGQSSHWVAYPLSLMPYESWHRLHHGHDLQHIPVLCCPVCGGKREATAHIRMMFLVAERLTWDEGLVSMQDKNLNARLNSQLNCELGIQSPFADHSDYVPGGKYSKINRYHPYQNEHEMMLALKLLFMTDSLTEAAWSLWIGMRLDMEKMLGLDEATCTSLPGTMTGGQAGVNKASSKIRTATALPTNAAVSTARESQSIADPEAYPNISERITSYRSLQDFYTLLDQIETTSYVGALFLEAYAERLRDDMCKDCWFSHNVKLDGF